jgi:chromate transport protein ChrA
MPSPPASEAASHADEATVGALCRYFLPLGALGLGGPVSLAGYMQRDLVEGRRGHEARPGSTL